MTLAPSPSATRPHVSTPLSSGHRGTSTSWGCTNTDLPASTGCCYLSFASYKGKICCYVFPLGSTDPPRFIKWLETASNCLDVPVLVRDSLHWYSEYYPSGSKPLHHQSDNKPVVVFDTIAESFRRMRAPVTEDAHIFDMDGTLDRRNARKQKETVDIWVMRNYESEVWDKKYRIKLSLAEIRERFMNDDDYCLDVVSGDGDVLVLLLLGRYVIHVNSDGELLDNFNLGRENLSMTKWRLKQSLVQCKKLPALEDYAVNASPWLPKPPYL